MTNKVRKGSIVLLFVMSMIVAIGIGSYITTPNAGETSDSEREQWIMYIGDEHNIYGGDEYYVYSGCIDQYGNDFIITKYRYTVGQLYQIIIDSKSEVPYVYINDKKWNIDDIKPYYIVLSRPK